MTLDELNHAPLPQAQAMLAGLYEHSDWIAHQALDQRPFKSLAQLQYAMAKVLDGAGREAQLALLRAHPELAGKGLVPGELTAESRHEQKKVGLTDCTPDELAAIQQFNADYRAKFGWPFIVAVRGPRGSGLSKAEILATMARRLQEHPDLELQECLRNVHRIVEIRLADKFGVQPTRGHQVWDWQEALAQHSDPGFAERGELTVTYLTAAHQACARDLVQRMQACGMDEVQIDCVGNVVGRYHPQQAGAPYVLTGSHYDTVRNGGKYDGRLGIFVPLSCVQALHQAGRRLPFGIEVVAFSEEEGQRFAATFLSASALTGSFAPQWLEQTDAYGISMRAAMQAAGLDPAGIPALQRDPAQYLGFVEVHIEQGPVLNALHLPLGLVTSINASVRLVGAVRGTASHAGTTPMDQRRDAACAVAELALYMEQRACADGDSVATIGQWQVPAGSVNVVPGRCEFSLDMRAPSDAQRDALCADVLAQLDAICQRRGLQSELRETMRASAAPSHPAWQQRWERAVQALGLPLHRMPSGAGHDAMKMHDILPQAMLFVRGQNRGISHNPLESSTSADMQLAIEALDHLLADLAETPV